MKSKRTPILVAFALLCILGMVVAIWLGRRKPPMLQTERSPEKPLPTETVPSQTISNNFASGEVQHVESSHVPAFNPNVPQSQLEKLQEAAAAKNVRIDFWGRVIDQDGEPITGVRVVMRAREWEVDSTSGPKTISKRTEATTDNSGNFSLNGGSGDSLQLEAIQKEGYRLSPKTQMGFAYGAGSDTFVPSEANPVLIHMWKSKPAEHLETFRTLFGFVADGRTYTMDLVLNQKHEGQAAEGDLLLNIRRSPPAQGSDKFEWSLELSAVDGGLVESHDDFNYMAPENYYQPRIVIESKPADPAWTANLTKDFFIRCKGGTVYGLLHLCIRPDYKDGQAAILFETRLSRGGSRNLEP
jgi:hypothetical protein